jgi:hypothetical protein
MENTMLTLTDILSCELRILREYLLFLAGLISDDNNSNMVIESDYLKNQFLAHLQQLEIKRQKLQKHISGIRDRDSSDAGSLSTFKEFPEDTFGELSNLSDAIFDIKRREICLNRLTDDLAEKSIELLLQLSPAGAQIFSNTHNNQRGKLVC